MANRGKYTIGLEVALSMGVVDNPRSKSQLELYSALNKAGYTWNTKTKDWDYSNPVSPAERFFDSPDGETLMGWLTEGKE